MGRELICKRLLSGEQAAPKERMRPRKSPARSKRLLIDVRTEVFRKSDDFVPASVFFNLGAGDEGGILTGVQDAHYDIECGGSGYHGTFHHGHNAWGNSYNGCKLKVKGAGSAKITNHSSCTIKNHMLDCD